VWRDIIEISNSHLELRPEDHRQMNVPDVERELQTGFYSKLSICFGTKIVLNVDAAIVASGKLDPRFIPKLISFCANAITSGGLCMGLNCSTILLSPFCNTLLSPVVV